MNSKKIYKLIFNILIMSILEKLQNKKGKKWLIFYFIFTFNFLLINLILFTIDESWGDLNIIVADYIGVYINLVLIIVLILSIPMIYGAVLFIYNLYKFKKVDEISPHKLHKIVPILIMFLFDVLFLLIIIFFEQYSKVIFQVNQYYSFIYLPIVCIILILLLKPVLKLGPKLKDYLSPSRFTPNFKAKTIKITIAALYVLVFISPMIFFPPNVVFGNLNPKPGLLGHRGGSHLAPEDTLIAMERAAENCAVGVEIDIRYSADGELILMHDSTLTRTTDVAEKFPDRKDDDVDTFTLAELRTLDVGSWFVENDPFGVIAKGIITSAEAEQYKGIQIPTYLEVMNFSRDHNFIVDLDTKFSNNTMFEKMINETLQSGIDLHNVIVAPGPEWIQIIEDRGATGIRMGINMRENPSLERFLAYPENYIVALCGDDFSDALYRQFYAANIPVMTDIIDSPERFSQLWCLGVTWVMTNEVHTFNIIEYPLNLPLGWYIFLWISIYIAAITMVILVQIKIKKER